jgi:RHS repeat-associated protein
LKVNSLANLKYSPHKTTSRNFGMQNIALRRCLFYGKKRKNFTGKELDAETGLYYYGARYLDPKTGRWLSGDPAMGEYFPVAPVNDETKKHNGNLPGQGGVFNYVNLHAYHYAGNNPVKYTDPDGKWFGADDVFTGPVDEIIVIAALVIAAKLGSKKAQKILDALVDALENLLKPKAPSIDQATQSDENVQNEPQTNTEETKDKDARLKGKPGDINKEGDKETKIGPDGRATRERHHSDHGNPRRHTNPHDHDIDWTENGDPSFGKPINYPDGVPPL